MAYAAGTTVSEQSSRAEIETMLRRAGATKSMTCQDTRSAAIAFEMNGRMIKFTLALPSPTEERFTMQVSQHKRPSDQIKTKRPPEAAAKLHDAECRRLWRCLALGIKAKLAAIADGISTFDVEFLPFVVMPGGRTVAEWLLPELDGAAKSGRLPALPLIGTQA